MSTLNFPDVNVWLALIWRRHEHAETARRWFDAADERFLYSRFTQISVLRLLTTESVLGVDTQTMSGAWKLWDRIIADERFAFLPEPTGIEPEFRNLTKMTSRSPKVWADAYILSFASVANLKLVTFDRALKLRGRDVVVL